MMSPTIHTPGTRLCCLTLAPPCTLTELRLRARVYDPEDIVCGFVIFLVRGRLRRALGTSLPQLGKYFPLNREEQLLTTSLTMAAVRVSTITASPLKTGVTNTTPHWEIEHPQYWRIPLPERKTIYALWQAQYAPAS